MPGNGLGNAWFNTGKPGDEQISLKEHVERMMEGENDADNTMGSCGVVCCGGAVDPEERG